MGRELNRFLNSGSLIHLGSNFPTFHGSQNSTTPDIVLANNKVYHNTTLSPGPLTTSDNTPIILEITPRAIAENIQSSINIKQAHWNQMETYIHNKSDNMNIPQYMTKDQIDERLNTWYQAIEESAKKNIPLKTRQVTHKPITSPRIRFIQHNCNELKKNSTLQGWTMQDYCRYQMPC